jgi:hypothetical protein
MRLVAMLGGCALLAWSSSDGARGAQPVIAQPVITESVISQSATAEAASIEQDSPAAPPASKTDPQTAAPPQATESAAQSPPPSGTPSGTTPPPAKPEAQSGPSSRPPAPAATQPASETAKPSSSVRGASTHRPKKKPGAVTATKTATPGAHPGKTPAQNASPKKVVVRNGGTSDPSEQLSPSLTEQQASSQRQTIDLLLLDTAANLKKRAGRPTSASQQDMMGQVHEYVQQAKAAADAGDIERAHNLAVKAHLLSEELAKH